MFEVIGLIFDNIKVGIYTLGCKVNQYESEAIAEKFASLGATVLSADNICDVYVINTCTVTAESDRKARQFIRRAISHKPDAYILVTGCLAQAAPAEIEKIAGVDYICGNTSKLSVVDAAALLMSKRQKNATPDVAVDEILCADFEKMSISHFDRTRAYIKIEDGCENKCTYCIIPTARGKVRSKLPNEIIDEIITLTEGGCREIVLTGIETASYGRDLGDVDLSDLLCRVDRIKNIGRVRLGSLDPSLITEKFTKRIEGLSSLTPHFHLSLQSGCDKILALMKRKYNSGMALRAMTLLRQALPNVQFTTDIIVGFPGETEEDFEETLEFVKRARFLKIHIFPYSKREGTPAASMKDQLTKSVKSERLARLSCLEADIRLQILREEIANRPECEVLFESLENGYAKGHTDNFIEVWAKSDIPLHSELRRVRLRETDGEVCFGEIIE